ncbi:MAG: hypothetical protein MI922_16240, partial [Bacteroidales bacterium]|nr:hypothetical protein [Bacteroidales bacterium]
MKKRIVFNHDKHNRTLTFMFISIFMLSFFNPSQGFGQTKVKVFLMAGQSNMQGHAQTQKLEKILCAKNELSLPGDPQGCYASLQSQEERLFQTISDFYWTGSEYGYGYEEEQARTEAQYIDQNNLIDARLLSPFDRVQMINFNYSRSNGVHNNPSLRKGPLKYGYGFSNNDRNYGPELAFGHQIAQHIEDDIVLLKVAEGGTNLHVQWRSPSMEARLGVGDQASNYPLLIQHINEVKTNIGSFLPKYAGVDVEIEIAGFVWFQGWNDGGNSTYANGYEQNLTDLITDLRNDLGITDLPVVIGQSHRGGENGLIIQAAQQSVGDNLANAGWFVTNDLSNYYHFDSGSHLIIGDRMGVKMASLLKPGIPITLPKPWKNSDIGEPQLTGSVAYDNGIFTIIGGGADIWGASDQFHYVYQPLSGDGEIIAKVESLTNTHGWAKAGVMIRSSLDANASHGMVICTPGGTTAFQRRIANGEESTNTQVNGGHSWVKLTRSSDTLAAFVSADGNNWQLIDTELTPMATDVYVGLAVTSHNSGKLCTALLSNVSVNVPVHLPISPSSLKAFAKSSENIALSWNDNSDNETGFKVERSLKSGSDFYEIAVLGAD